MIRFVIPAYNEEENIGRLLDDLRPRALELGARVIIVDDGSTDRTAEVIEEHRGDLHLHVVTHKVNRGLGTALNSGLRAAVGESADDDAIVTIEADCTSDLDDLPAMLEKFEAGADLVLASVYMEGGAIIGVPTWRLNVSQAVSGTFRVAGNLQHIRTLSALYRIYRAGTIRAASETYGYLMVREPGFAANVELLLKLYNAGATVAEVPTVNDWGRRRGASKLSFKKTVPAYMRLMAAHLVHRMQPPPISPLSDEE